VQRGHFGAAFSQNSRFVSRRSGWPT
jgi:hypothetical protein